MKVSNLFQSTTKPIYKPTMNQLPAEPQNDAFVKDGSIVLPYEGAFYLVNWEVNGTYSDRTASVCVNAIDHCDHRGNVIRKFNLKWYNEALFLEAVHAAYAHVGKNHLPDYTLSQVIN